MAKHSAGQRKNRSQRSAGHSAHGPDGSGAERSRGGRTSRPRPFDLSPSLQRWLPPALFLLTTLIFFWPQLSGTAFFWEDFVEQFFPWQSFAAAHTAGFTLPHWTPYAFNGMPFLADAQVGYFYPPHWFLALFVGAEGLPIGVLQALVILHFFVAQWGMYSLARHFACGAPAAIVAGIAYGFSAPLVLHAFHPMIVYHLAWFPLVIRCTHAALTRADWRQAVWAGLLLGMMLLAGHPQTSLYAVTFLAAMSVWIIAAQMRASGAENSSTAASPLGGVARFGAVLALAVGLFCIQYLPTSELADYSERSEMTYEAAGEGSLQFGQLLAAVTPKVTGESLPRDAENAAPYFLEGGQYYFYWETGFYSGIVVLFLAIIGIGLRLRSREGAFLLAAGIFALLFALGSNGPLFPLMFHLPFFGQFRFPPRIMFFVVVGLSLFAGWGLDALLKQEVGLKRSALIGGGVLLVICLAAVSGVLPQMFGAPTEEIADAAAAAALPGLLLLLAAVAVYFLAVKRIIPGAAVFGAIAVLVFVDAFNFGAAFNRSGSDPETEYALQPEMKDMFRTDEPDSLFRVKMREGPVIAMKRNQGLIDSIMLYEGYNPLLLKNRIPPADSLSVSLDLLNIKYEVKFDPQQGGYWATRPDAMPRAWMVFNAVTLADADAVAEHMKHNRIDYRSNVVLMREPEHKLSGADARNVRHSVKIARYDHNSMEFNVDAAEAGFLCLSEVWYPAWTARIDGRETPVYRANHAQRAINIPAGEHTVILEYNSSSFNTGRLISILTLLVAVGALVFLSIRQNGAARQQADSPAAR